MASGTRLAVERDSGIVTPSMPQTTNNVALENTLTSSVRQKRQSDGLPAPHAKKKKTHQTLPSSSSSSSSSSKSSTSSQSSSSSTNRGGIRPGSGRPIKNVMHNYMTEICEPWNKGTKQAAIAKHLARKHNLPETDCNRTTINETIKYAKKTHLSRSSLQILPMVQSRRQMNVR